MADEHQVTPTRAPAIDSPSGPKRTPAFPGEPAAARAEIEATRARMSETIDEIEDVLLRKKEKIRDQLDVLAPIREEPVKMLAMIFGGALALGLLTGGRKKRHSDQVVRLELGRGPFDAPAADDGAEIEEDEEDEEAALAWERAEAWEDRAHRLLRIAKAQEAELEIHRSRRDTLLRRLRTAEADDDEEPDDEDFEEPNFFDRIRETAATRLAGIASEVSQRMMRGA